MSKSRKKRKTPKRVVSYLTDKLITARRWFNISGRGAEDHTVPIDISNLQ